MTGGCLFPIDQQWPGHQEKKIKLKYMQRVAILSFVGVIVLLMAFTVHESGKQKAARRCTARPLTTQLSETSPVEARQ